ncbi:hypothetical protein FA15DRAFT_553809, partial [Coprinopsis marcescibilis]
HLFKRFSGARWSWYDAQTGSAGACGTYIGNADFVSSCGGFAQFGSGYPGPHCFETITMSYGGRTAQAVILDMCPGCPYGGLDLTPSLFQFFADPGAGIIYGEWDF